MKRPGFLLLIATSVLVPMAAHATLPHLDLDLRLDPKSRAMHAVAVLPGGQSLRFTLHRSLEVRSAWSDGVPLAFEAVGAANSTRQWHVHTPRDTAVRIEYAGTLPTLDRSLTHRDVLQNMTPMASPEGSFLPAASGWYPAPGPQFTYRLKLSLPDGQRGLVAGRLVDEALPRAEAQSYTATFEFAQGADGIDLMAGPYTVREKIVPRAAARPLRVRTYFYPEIETLSSDYIEDSLRYITQYSRSIGEYPFSEFSIVASPLPTGFGMPTLTYIGAQVLRLPFIRATSLGHEVLHNWWGNGVSVDYTTGNWAEGLTTFMADYANKERESPRAALEMRLGWLRDFAAVPADDQRPLVEFRARTHGAAAALGYGKAAMLFYMLRDLIGEQAFEQGLRDFWRAKRFRKASWTDLREAFESASRRPLADFFAQWLERTGGPALELERASAAPNDKGGFDLSLSFSQAAPAYRLSVPVEVASGADSRTYRVDIDALTQQARIELERVPDGVRLDPQLRLWRMLAPEELPPILRQWILARSPRVAVASADSALREAALALAERLFERKPAVISHLQAALRDNEPILLAGIHAAIDTELARSGLPPRPATLAGRGSAQVWTIAAAPGRAPVAVVSVRDAPALRELRRPLPHYGSQSYLAFDGARAIERGIWPAAGKVHAVAR